MAQEKKLDEVLAKIEKKITGMDPLSVNDMPDVPLYMDQLTTLMDSKLRSTLRHPSEDKVLTKTMINNYAKNDLIPPPLKKRYSKDHVYELLFIFYFKNFLSIGDIQNLLSPLTADFFGKDKTYGMDQVYDEILSLSRGARASLHETIDAKYKAIEHSFEKAPEDKREYLRKFAFVCELGYDIFLKKYYIEQIIDEIAEDYAASIDNYYDEELTKKAAKEAVNEASRVAKEREERDRLLKKAKAEKLKNDRNSFMKSTKGRI